MGAVQMMCARIGMVTGEGLAAALHARFPRWLVGAAVVALLVVNTITVGADLSGMADAMEMLTGANSHYFVVLFGGFWFTRRSAFVTANSRTFGNGWPSV